MPSLASLLWLPRPEYAKQTELVLVDLLWKSLGTSLGEADAIRGLPRKREQGRPATRRLVVEQVGRGDSNVTPTREWVLEAAADQLFRDSADARRFGAAVLASIAAPRSRNDRSRTCVPVHRGILPLQTLNGAVNKDQPPDLATAVERMAVLGGALAVGDAAALLARAMDDVADSDLDRFFDHIARPVWRHEDNHHLPEWPGTLTTATPRAAEPISGACQVGPPHWFWRNWSRLLDPAAGWRAALPERRFMDWATCLLRTGLAMTYLWESATFRTLRDYRSDPTDDSWRRLVAAVEVPVLLTIHPPSVPIAERNIMPLLGPGLGDGYWARLWFDEAVRNGTDENVGGFSFDVGEDREQVRERLARIGGDDGDAYRDPRSAPKTLREFVRYLLQARSANDASPDETDFYYLARSEGRAVYVEPGPEWLVVVASLAAGRPGGQCTLRDVLRELRDLGFRVDRSTLVAALEGVGLSQDSPDADDGIIVSSGF